MVSTTGMVVSLKTDLRFPESGQQGHGAQIIQAEKSDGKEMGRRGKCNESIVSKRTE